MNLMPPAPIEISAVIGKIPYRMAFAGGWIDQPFISRLKSNSPGSMVVVSLHPTVRFMEGAEWEPARVKWPWNVGRRFARSRPGQALCASYSAAENNGKPEPSGSQDMLALFTRASAGWTTIIPTRRVFPGAR